jgi:tRNA modification GTPase
MRAPKSYTCEDMAEISGHGGPVVLKIILSRALECGARLAEPGEFTRRAFLNGRLDLVQAEAVLDIIQAKNESFLKVSANQLKGELTKELEAIREQLMTAYTQLEAGVNFPDEDIPAIESGAMTAALAVIRQRIETLLASSDQGRILREGIRVVICGKTNVGKSSLLNVLLRQPRAIVSPIEGTTRDTIEEAVTIDGVMLQLVDTAGIIAPRDIIEAEAVSRSQKFIHSADLVLLVLDSSVAINNEDRQIRDALRQQPVLLVVNKTDLEKQLPDSAIRGFLPGKPVLRVSATEKTGIDELRQAIVAAVMQGQAIDTHRLTVTNLRHVESLREGLDAVRRAEDAIGQNISPEFISEDVRIAINALDAITGRNIDADLLDKIFSGFCIGK